MVTFVPSPLLFEARAFEIVRGQNGAPGESRTPDLLVRSQTLYPAELRAPRCRCCVRTVYDTRRNPSTTCKLGVATTPRCFQRRVSLGGSAANLDRDQAQGKLLVGRVGIDKILACISECVNNKFYDCS
jgi:hypothetical protein